MKDFKSITESNLLGYAIYGLTYEYGVKKRALERRKKYAHTAESDEQRTMWEADVKHTEEILQEIWEQKRELQARRDELDGIVREHPYHDAVDEMIVRSGMSQEG
jgi:hypothetical protein